MEINKILIVFPGLNLDIDEGAKHRLNCHINEYHKRGNDVTVLAVCKRGMFRSDRKKFMNPNAKWILMPYLLPMSKHIIFCRITDIYLKIMVACLTWINKFDIIQMEFQNLKTRLCRKAFYITDIHGDAVYETIESRNKTSNHWYVNYLKELQQNFIKKSDFCITVSENLKKQIEFNTNCYIGNYSIISCGVNYEKFANAKKQTIPFDLSNRIVLGYSGGLQAWQNFDKIIDIIIELRTKNPLIFFLVYTNNSIEPYKEKLSLIGEENYYIKSLMSSEVPGYLKLFDAGFLIRDDKILNKVSSPTKICEYLAAGVPLICTKYSGDYDRSIIDRQNGFVLNNSTPTTNEYYNLILWLDQLKHKQAEIKVQCKEAASKRTFSQEFEIFYSKIMKKRKN